MLLGETPVSVTDEGTSQLDLYPNHTNTPSWEFFVLYTRSIRKNDFKLKPSQGEKFSSAEILSSRGISLKIANTCL